MNDFHGKQSMMRWTFGDKNKENSWYEGDELDAINIDFELSAIRIKRYYGQTNANTFTWIKNHLQAAGKVGHVLSSKFRNIILVVVSMANLGVYEKLIAVYSRVHTVVHCSRNYFSRKCKCQSACPHDKYRNQKTRVFINWWRQLGNEYQKYRVTSRWLDFKTGWCKIQSDYLSYFLLLNTCWKAQMICWIY